MSLLRRLVIWAAVGGLLLWITSLLLGPSSAPGSISPPSLAIAPSQSSTPSAPGKAGMPTAIPTSAAHPRPTPTPRPTATPTLTPRPSAIPTPVPAPSSRPTPTPTPTPTPAPTPTATPTPTPTPAPTPTPTPALPTFSHVFVIVMENEESNSLIGNSAAPYINGLAASYGLATQYYAISHPSLPNYLTLTAGSTFGINSD